jgi:hypothetical protein
VRSVTITSIGGRPLTVNAIVNLHRMQWAKKTKEIREEFALRAFAERNARPAANEKASRRKTMFDAIHVEATPLHRDGRSPQDVAACAPHVKAAIDGLVDGGLIEDDDATHLHSITFRPPCICGEDGLRLVITEAL